MSMSPLISPRVLRARWKPAAAMLVVLAAATGCSPQAATDAAAQPTPAQPAPEQAAPVQPAADAHADHAMHATAPADAAPLPPPGQRWATDAPLRAGMARIRLAVEALQHGLMGHLTEAQQKDAAAQVDAAVADMIANCKLEPEADASLHGLLAPFVAGAGAVRDGSFGQPELAAMQGALAQYPQRFDDKTWDQPAQD